MSEAFKNLHNDLAPRAPRNRYRFPDRAAAELAEAQASEKVRLLESAIESISRGFIPYTMDHAWGESVAQNAGSLTVTFYPTRSMMDREGMVRVTESGESSEHTFAHWCTYTEACAYFRSIGHRIGYEPLGWLEGEAHRCLQAGGWRNMIMPGMKKA